MKCNEPEYLEDMLKNATFDREKFRICTKCGIWFITSRFYHGEECLECNPGKKYKKHKKKTGLKMAMTGETV